MFFESFSKGPRGLHYVFLITCKVPTFGPVDGLTFISIEPLSLGKARGFLMMVLPLKWVCMPYLLQIILMIFHRLQV